MRRTYRSKKETGGTFEHRDVLLNMDEKSSAFDAFYIHNIKQTKRELSTVGSSNHLGVASNKVRKRKYVKRIVKEVEPVRQKETMSSSAYLTPDKSIRVNKVLDPFDMLLNSSTVFPEAKVTNVEEKEKLPKKAYKMNTRKRQPKFKKFNYSSSDSYNSESDKENSIHAQNNVTDIRSHELLIERVNSNSPKYQDESIYKIVNNMSLINNIKKSTPKSSFNTSYKLNHSRLTKFHSPILPKSPLCSTPYREKYRGLSIYKFSPINYKKGQENSPIAIEEEKEESNNSIILVNKTGNTKSLKNCTPQNYLSIKKSLANEKTEHDHISIQGNAEIIEQNDTNYNLVSNDTNFCSFQMTDAEPFLGFSNIETEGNISKNISILKHIEDELEIAEIDSSYDDIREMETKNNNANDSLVSNTSSILNKCNTSDSSNSSTMDSPTSDKESLYNTCNSDQSFDFKEPVVSIERMNDSIFLKYYEKMIESQMDSETESDDFESLANGSDGSNDFIDEAGIIQIKPNVITITDSSTNEDIISSNVENESNDEEKCISFVTTRRRNDVTADTMVVFDNSFVSSSTDCDKTVLSNKVNLEKFDLDNSVNITDNNEVDKINESLANIKTRRCSRVSGQQKSVESSSDSDDRFSKVSYRKSSRSTRSGLTSSQHLDVSTNEETLIDENEPINKTVVENAFDLITNSVKVPMTYKPNRNSLSYIERSSYAGTESKPIIVLQPGKKWERSLSIYRRMTTMSDFEQSILEDECLVGKKGRKYRQSVISTMGMQERRDSLYNDSIYNRSSILSKPGRPTIRFVKDPNLSRVSLNTTSIHEDLKGFLNEECDDTIIELSKLSIGDPEHEVSILDKFHDTERGLTARDYVLRRCNQIEPILFDECYPETVLKNCHKIGEGVYGEVYLWRARDGRARVMKIVPIAGSVKVNGEDQKDFHEIISEIVIAMELSALRAPIADIERQLDEGNDVRALDLHAIENATDIFNEVLAVRCVYGPYPSRLLDLWELYDECKGSENDSPATLPPTQRYIVLELANAGLDLESYQFTSAQQAHALFQQLAYGLAVAEEAYQFEHRDLHWGNVLIAPTEQKVATFILRGRTYRTPRHGVAATIIDYSLSRLTVPISSEHTQAALYNDLATDEQLFDAVGDYQFEVYRLMRDKLGNDWKSFEPYTNILWLHYTVDKMITALRYKRTNTKIHKHYIEQLKGIKERILEYGSAVQYVLTDIEF